MDLGKNGWLWIGGAIVALYLLNQSSAAAEPVTAAPASSGGSMPVSNLPAGQTNSNTQVPVASAVPTNYGVNGGKGIDPTTGNPSDYDFASNYTALIAANPNLLNPNYQLAPAEIAQYLANYLDLRGGGLTPSTAQQHWTNYGVSQERIFIPLVPVSSEAWQPN